MAWSRVHKYRKKYNFFFLDFYILYLWATNEYKLATHTNCDHYSLLTLFNSIFFSSSLQRSAGKFIFHVLYTIYNLHGVRFVLNFCIRAQTELAFSILRIETTQYFSQSNGISECLNKSKLILIWVVGECNDDRQIIPNGWTNVWHDRCAWFTMRSVFWIKYDKKYSCVMNVCIPLVLSGGKFFSSRFHFRILRSRTEEEK